MSVLDLKFYGVNIMVIFVIIRYITLNLMKFSRFYLVFAVLAAISCTKTEDFVSFVDTSIGTGGHGHVFKGANVPFGAVQLGPTSIPESWDWCSGYHVSDSTLVGFSHTHLSGTGIGDLFDITVMPVNTREIEYTREGIATKADRTREVSEPGYYSVPVEGYDVTAELTATARVGLHRYTWNAAGADNAIIFDLENGGCWDEVTEGSIEQVNDSSIKGYRYSKGWADDQKIYFTAEFSEPFGSLEKVGEYYYRVNFPNAEKVMVKVAISAESTDGAAANMAHTSPFAAISSLKCRAASIPAASPMETRESYFLTSRLSTLNSFISIGILFSR